jgi:hypothetical protein
MFYAIIPTVQNEWKEVYMKIITHQVETLYRYNGKFYKVSSKRMLEVGDVVIDGRDYNFKVMESNQDVMDMSYVAPELYCVLDETAIQN